ncbi:MAG: hypothetical protein LUG83_10220, partial [Lachnospiraceae bacterium]|nr:hypothetical protein [Lachnospiraceae bacterium]
MVVLCIFIMAACITDYSMGRIPNKLLFVMAAAGAAESLLHGGAINALFFVLKASAVIFILYPMFR